MASISQPVAPLRKMEPEHGDGNIQAWYCKGLPLWVRYSDSDPQHVQIVALDRNMRLGYVETVFFASLLDKAQELLRQARTPTASQMGSEEEAVATPKTLRQAGYSLRSYFRSQVISRVVYCVTPFWRCFRLAASGLKRILPSQSHEREKAPQKPSLLGESLDASLDSETLAMMEQVRATRATVDEMIRVTEADKDHVPMTQVSFVVPKWSLNEDELETLYIAVSGAQSAYVDMLASHFVAVPFDQRSHGLRHLMEAGKRDRKGPTLCGCLPPSPSSSLCLSGEWMLFAFYPPNNYVPTCPECLRIYQDQKYPDPKLIEKLLFFEE